MLARKWAVACVALSVSVTGCAEGPSEQEVEAAFRAHVADSDITAASVRGIRCRSATGGDAYDCAVTAAMTFPGAATVQASGNLRLIRSNDSGVFDPNQPLEMSGFPSRGAKGGRR